MLMSIEAIKSAVIETVETRWAAWLPLFVSILSVIILIYTFLFFCFVFWSFI